MRRRQLPKSLRVGDRDYTYGRSRSSPTSRGLARSTWGRVSNPQLNARLLMWRTENAQDSDALLIVADVSKLVSWSINAVHVM